MIDQAMNWLVDFRAAEDLGMALRLAVSGPVDVLLVTGVRASDGDDGATELAALLKAQRYSEGLGFLSPETRTNNADGGSSGWSSADAGSWTARPAEPAPDSFGALVATALGLDGATDLFGSLVGAAETDDPIAEAMSTVLWPSTWGYWLPQFAGMALPDVGLGQGPRAAVSSSGRPAAHLAGRTPAVRAAAGDLAGTVRRRRAREPSAARPRRAGGRFLASGRRPGAADRARPGRR